MEEKRAPIADGEKAIILFLAIILDALSIIPGIGTFVAFLGLFSIGIWSWVRLGKMPFTKKLRKYITKRAFIFLVEALPIAQIFPGWTVMALMGFQQGGQSKGGGVVGALALVASLLLLPGKSLALELSYPSFFPIHEGLQLNELIQIIFTASLTLGAVLAFVSLVYTGFEYIVSGDNPGKRSEARQHVINAVAGIIILLSSVLILRVINPNLVTIPPILVNALRIEEPQITPGQDPASEEIGGDYARLRLSENLNTLEEALEKIQGEDSSLLAIIAERMKECGPNLCTPGSIPYTVLEEYDCAYESCSTDDEGNESCGTVSATCSQCVPAVCTGSSCEGEPLSGKDKLAEQVSGAVKQFNDLQSLYRTIELGRGTISSCGENSISCVSLRAAGSSQSCDPAQDFFCGASGTSSVALPLRELVALEEKFIPAIKDISKQLLGATCSNTTFSCDGGCGGVTGQCTPSDAPSGCPPELFTAARALDEIGGAMDAQRQQLSSIIASADSALEISTQSGGEALLLSCAEARALVADLRQSGVYKDGTCATTTTCCPTPQVEEVLRQCDPVDLFLCS